MKMNEITKINYRNGLISFLIVVACFYIIVAKRTSPFDWELYFIHLPLCLGVFLPLVIIHNWEIIKEKWN